MAGVTNIPLTTLNDGVRHFGPAAVADADTLTVLSIDRTVAGGLNSLTSATSYEISVEQSNDGGVNWFSLVDGVITGGIQPAPKGGGNATTSNTAVRYPPGTGRQVRVTLTVTGGPVAVQGSLTTS